MQLPEWLEWVLKFFNFKICILAISEYIENLVMTSYSEERKVINFSWHSLNLAALELLSSTLMHEPIHLAPSGQTQPVFFFVVFMSKQYS